MITIKAEVLKNKQKSDGTYNVKIRITYMREVKRLATPIYVRQEDLTKSFKLKNPKFIKEVNRIVREYQETCASLHMENSNLSLTEIIELLQTKKESQITIDFIEYSKKWIKSTELKGKANYQISLNAFIAYLGKEKLRTNQMTKGLMEGFIKYLQAKRTKQITLLLEKGKRIPFHYILAVSDIYFMRLRNITMIMIETLYQSPILRLKT